MSLRFNFEKILEIELDKKPKSKFRACENASRIDLALEK